MARGVREEKIEREGEKSGRVERREGERRGETLGKSHGSSGGIVGNGSHEDVSPQSPLVGRYDLVGWCAGCDHAYVLQKKKKKKKKKN